MEIKYLGSLLGVLARIDNNYRYNYKKYIGVI